MECRSRSCRGAAAIEAVGSMTKHNEVYGWPHRRLRARMLPSAYGRPCHICGRVMLKGHALDLDHVVPVALGVEDSNRRIVHAHCNRRAGAKLRFRQRRVLRPAPWTTSRSW